MALTYALINNNTEYEVSSCDGVETVIKIPAYYNGKPVTSIGARAFLDCKHLVGIELGENIKIIGDWSFARCDSLSTVVLNNKLESIGERAFYNCTKLNNVNLGKNITTIKNYAFYNCSSFTYIVIPKTAVTIGGQIFTGCSNVHIYCEAVNKPDGWASNWNSAGYPVTWGFSYTPECIIEYDDEWIQDGCHWKYDRIFTLTFKVLSDYSGLDLLYRFGPQTQNIDDYTRINIKDSSQTTVNGMKIFTYTIRLADVSLDTLLAGRDTDGWLTVSTFARVRFDSGELLQAFKTYLLYLELPPETKTSEEAEFKTELIMKKPGELLCSWNEFKTADSNVADTVDGYCIELLHCPRADYEEAEKNSTEAHFENVLGLKWDENKLSEGNYYLTRVMPEKLEFNSIPDDVTNTDITFQSQAATGEVYTDNLDKKIYPNLTSITQFTFKPRELGLNKGDYYKFRLYPYSHYEGALISNIGNASASRRVPKAAVRVKTDSGWVEGIVWVMVDDGTGHGTWTEADSVYAKTDKGWEEST